MLGFSLNQAFNVELAGSTYIQMEKREGWASMQSWRTSTILKSDSSFLLTVSCFVFFYLPLQQHPLIIPLTLLIDGSNYLLHCWSCRQFRLAALCSSLCHNKNCPFIRKLRPNFPQIIPSTRWLVWLRVRTFRCCAALLPARLQLICFDKGSTLFIRVLLSPNSRWGNPGDRGARRHRAPFLSLSKALPGWQHLFYDC